MSDFTFSREDVELLRSLGKIGDPTVRIGAMIKRLATRHEVTIIVRDRDQTKSVGIVPEHIDRLEPLLKVLVEWSEKQLTRSGSS